MLPSCTHWPEQQPESGPAMAQTEPGEPQHVPFVQTSPGPLAMPGRQSAVLAQEPPRTTRQVLSLQQVRLRFMQQSESTLHKPVAGAQLAASSCEPLLPPPLLLLLLLLELEPLEDPPPLPLDEPPLLELDVPFPLPAPLPEPVPLELLPPEPPPPLPPDPEPDPLEQALAMTVTHDNPSPQSQLLIMKPSSSARAGCTVQRAAPAGGCITEAPGAPRCHDVRPSAGHRAASPKSSSLSFP
jgi:hypothetical protein